MSKNEIALKQKDIGEIVISKLNELQNEGLKLFPTYAPQNALKSAFFELINSTNGNLLEKYDKTNIANVLLDMAIQGLSPNKKQCYFIPYGNKLILQRSYFGTVAVAKQIANIDITAIVIYEGDEFETEILNGVERVVKHKTSWLNRDNEIVGAYAIVTEKNGRENLTVMTKKEIEASWSKGKVKTVQQQFPQEMAKRTVINRACKMYINTSDDNGILSEAYNRTLENEFVQEETLVYRKNKLNTEIEKTYTEEIQIIDIEKLEETEVENTQNQEETY